MPDWQPRGDEEVERIATEVNVYPGVPADIEIDFEFHSLDGKVTLTETVSGKANSFGYFDGDGKAFNMASPGEYAVNIRASFEDEEGRLWMATRKWGSAVSHHWSRL